MADLLDLQRRWTLGDRSEQQIREVLVEVPSGVGAIEVELDYDHAGEAVIDLGLLGPHGYLGWSGGARSGFVISEGFATPGYQPAPTEQGAWQILLGLHRIAPEGTDCRLTVRSVSAERVQEHRRREPGDPPVGQRPERRELPAAGRRRWYAGDFHAHTVHSDGVSSIGGLAELAASRGLDFLAVTDHNTISHHAHLPAAAQRHGITLVPGQEVTRDIGHANAFGALPVIDFRAPAAQWQRQVADHGGLLSVNHPLSGDCAWLQPLPEPTRIAEVWHSSWSMVPTWGAPLAWWQAWNNWGRARTVAIGGSDFHRPGSDAPPGAPTTWVLAEPGPDGRPSPESVLEAVAAGRTSISRDRLGPLLLPEADGLTVVAGEGLLLTGFDGRSVPITTERVELARPAGPIWLEDDRRVVHALTG